MAEFIDLEKAKILKEINNLVTGLKATRLKLLTNNKLLAEVLSDDPNSVSNLDYYAMVQAYGNQRANLLGRTSSDMDYYAIANATTYNSVSADSFIVPTTTTFIFDTFDANGNNLLFDVNTMYLQKNGNSLVKPLDVILANKTNVDILNKLDTELAIVQEVFSGGTVNKVTVPFTFDILPSIGDKFILRQSSDNLVIGYIEVSSQGFELDTSWDLLAGIYDDVFVNTFTEFMTLTHGLLQNYTTFDDITKSVDPTLKSNSDARENNPFFPTLTGDSEDLPSDTNAPYSLNEWFDGAPDWAVQSKFRWEGKIPQPYSSENFPVNTLSDVISEYIPSTTLIDIWNSISGISSTGNPSYPSFPVSDVVTNYGDIRYIFKTSDYMIYQEVWTEDLINSNDYFNTPTIANGVWWNTFVVSNLALFNNNLTIISNNTISNTVENTVSEENSFKLIIDDILSKIGVFETEWKNEKVNDYIFPTTATSASANLQNSISDLDAISSTTLSDRLSLIDSRLGDLGGSGYSAKAYASANLLVNKSYGVLGNNVKNQIEYQNILDAITSKRNYYNALP